MVWEPPPGSDPADVVEQLARDVLAVFTEAEARLLADLARRTRIEAEVPAWAAEKAAAVREVRLAVERLITQLRADASQGAADAVLAAWQAGAAAALAQLWDAGALDDQLAALRDVIPGMDAAALLAADLTSRLDALHLRILRWGQDAYQVAVAAAAPAQLLGTDMTRSAQRSAWDRLVSQGVTGFVDRAGRGWNLASYVEMATRTATGRAWNEGHLARLDALGVDLVTISRTTDGCALCSVWEGHVLARTGIAGTRTVENELTDAPMRVEVAGTVDEARAAGLMHPNCRHTFLPFIPGVTRLAAPVEHDQAAEDEREHLRKLERKIRREKRKEAGALDDADRRRAQRKIRALQAEIRDHITATGLNRKRYREQLNLAHGDLQAARRRRDAVADQIAEGTAEQARLDAVTAEQARRREQERLAAEKAERDRFAAELVELSDEDLETRFAEVADDETLLDLVLAEMDRRQAEEQLAAERRERDQQRRERQRQEREEAQWQRFEELTGQGWSEEDAVAEAFGISVEQQRRDRAIARLRELGYTGRGLDELARKAFRDHVYEQYIEAENATRGHMLTPQGQAAGIDPHDLFTGPASRARKWASDELKEWWDEHGRITYDEWVARLLGDDPGFQGTTGDSWLQ